MESGRYMFIFYETYISHITFMSQDAVYIWSFLIKLSDLGTIPDMKTLSVLQVIAKLRIPIVISSVASIVFKSFVAVCRIIIIIRFLLDYWNDVRFHVLTFCNAKMFHDEFASTTWHFPAFNLLNHRITKYDGNWERPLVRCITFSFIVWILCVLSSCINYVLFRSYFCVCSVSSSVGLSSVSSGAWRFLVSIGCITLDLFFS